MNPTQTRHHAPRANETFREDNHGRRDDTILDKTAGPSESLDSDDVHNDDGYVAVDAADRWIAAV